MLKTCVLPIALLLLALSSSCNPPITEADRQKWIQPGKCQTPNQVKMHGVMNDVTVDWTCPLCKSSIHDLRWDICEQCCERLGICVVCRKNF